MVKLMQNIIVEAVGLRKIYPDGTVAVDNVSFTAGKGVTVFMGPNGSGKTTTMLIVAGALKPTSGRVFVCGFDVWGEEWAKARECIGFAPQETPFREKLSVFDNLVWYGLLKGLSFFDARSEARKLLELVGLEDKRSKKVQQLSGGMRKRLAIAAALVGNPHILLLDEPTTGLDPVARNELWSLLNSLAKDKAIIVSTHLPEEAENFAKTVYMFYRGRIIAWGSPSELISKYAPKARIVIKAERIVELFHIDGIETVGIQDDEIVFAAYDPDRVLPRIVEKAIGAGMRVKRIEVMRPGLAEVFARLVRMVKEGRRG